MTSAVLTMLGKIAPKPAKTVDGVLTAFKTAIEDLEAVREQSMQTAQDLEQQALTASINARAAREEAARAQEVTGKLRNLIAA